MVFMTITTAAAITITLFPEQTGSLCTGERGMGESYVGQTLTGWPRDTEQVLWDLSPEPRALTSWNVRTDP